MKFSMTKQELLSSIQLYVIADKRICGNRDIESVVSESINGGAEMIQYRDKESDDNRFLKTASQLQAICKARNIPFIVNDRVEIAVKIDADGVHVGQEDMPLFEVRKKVSPDKIIGVSATSIQQVKEAEENGTDYIGIGPIFNTLSKEIKEPVGLEIIREAKACLKIPFYAIGGINLDNLDSLIQTGVSRIAVISAIILSDDIKSTTAKLLDKLKEAPN
jgi:thiamine-phosphate pyrophosphorylase